MRGGYKRREPEKSALYRVLQEHLNSFMAALGDRGLPKFVTDALYGFLECGILAFGFARVRCPECGYNRVVAFSCKQRGICPSCEGRRMTEQAAWLVDNVIPYVPVRQWVLSLPFKIRFILAKNGRLKRQVLRIFLSEVFRATKKRAGKRGKCGAVTVVQRFGSSLNLNVHFHSLVLDGVYVKGPPGGEPIFIPAPPLTRAALEELVRKIRRRVLAHLVKRGAIGDVELGEDDPPPALAEATAGEPAEEPTTLDLFSAASIREMIAMSPEPRGVAVLGKVIDVPFEWDPPKDAAFTDGFSLHCKVAIDADDREGLERVCRYILRPPFAADRFTLLENGMVAYRLKRPRRDGTTHLVLKPFELIEKLAALIPPPRQHQLHYHGCLGPNDSWRNLVVLIPTDGDADRRKRSKRLTWAALLKRAFGIDVMECPECGGRMRVISEISKTQPEVIKAILESMGLPSEAPPLAPARDPPEPDPTFPWDSAA